MNNSTTKRIITSVVLAITCFVVLIMTSYAEENVKFSTVDLQESYVVGEVISIPVVTASVGNQTYNTQATLFRPDGVATSSSNEVLSIAGKYTLRYSVYLGSKEYRNEYSFIVNKPLFETEKKSSTAVYDADLGAIALTLDNKTKFIYNGVIDLTDNDRTQPLIELYNVADVDGEKNFGQVMIVLTDLEDESNSIYIRVNESDGFGQYAYANYTAYTAVSIGSANNFRGLEGSHLHMNDRYGTVCRFSFCNLGMGGATPENDRVRIFWDYNEKQVVVSSSSSPAEVGVVVDFDSPDCYKEFWEGFSNGKCRIAVYATAMYKTNAKIFITGIDGQDLSCAIAEDTESPEFTIDVPDTVPKGIVGYNYPVFPYTVRDDNGVKSSSVNVYYNYYSDHPASITIKDGKVKPPYAGKYTLVYRAEDYYGNVVEEVVDFSVDSAGVASKLTLDVNGSYEGCLAGEMVSILPSAISYNPVYGSVTEQVVASCNGISLDITGLEAFRPIAVGEWTVTYSVTDALGREASCSKTFTAAVNNTPVFLNDNFSMLPQYFVSGTTYELPALYATSFGANVTEALASIKYAVDGTEQAVSGYKFTPVSSRALSNVVITYFVDGAEVTVTRPIVNPYDGNRLDITRLFQVVNGSADIVSNNTGLAFTANTDFVSDFINPIIYSKLQLGLTIKGTSKVTFTLNDVDNSELELTIGFVGANGKYDMYVNGVKVDTITRSTISIKFEGTKMLVNSATYNLKKYLDGSEFTEFDSGKVYVRMSMAEGSSVELDKIGNQTLRKTNSDLIDPMMWVDENIDLYVNLNASIVLPDALACDAISGACPITVTARLNGKYLKTADGREIKDLPYEPGLEVVLSEYGNCFINYKTADAADNPFSVSLAVYVIDDVKPELEVSATIPNSAVVGDTIKVEGLVATDNYSFEVVTCVITIDPALAYDVSKDGTITFDCAGKWIVRCVAYDESGNLGYVDYTVVVKEAK